MDSGSLATKVIQDKAMIYDPVQVTDVPGKYALSAYMYAQYIKSAEREYTNCVCVEEGGLYGEDTGYRVNSVYKL